ncbi:MAG TPA: hypothetical protein VKE22_02325 [Haliangiales bacterium]|nr:hypothetical protein [Haliangiales bacterium]
MGSIRKPARSIASTGTTTATMRIYDANYRLVAGTPIYSSTMEPFGPGVCLLATGSAHLDTLVFH